MSLLRSALRRPQGLTAWYPAAWRCYASKGEPATAAAAAEPAAATESAKTNDEAVSKSSCAENTVLTGLQYLKNQPPMLAQADDAYPPWLWTLLDPKKLLDDGPGGKAEKYRLRRENRQRIRDQNFMKTQ